MRNLFAAAKLLLLDMASTFFFLVLFLLTKNIPLSVMLGVTLGVAQIGIQFARGKRIETMEWLSLFVVVASGAATLLTNDPRFVMIKPSVLYVIVGVVMLKPGWMNRYLPPAAKELVPDVATIFGFVWAGLMFATAALNIVVALNFSVAACSAVMAVFAIGSSSRCFSLATPSCARSPSAAAALESHPASPRQDENGDPATRAEFRPTRIGDPSSSSMTCRPPRSR